MSMKVEFWTKDDQKVGLLEFHGIAVESGGTKALEREEPKVVEVDRPAHLTQEEIDRIAEELSGGEQEGETEHYNWWSALA